MGAPADRLIAAGCLRGAAFVIAARIGKLVEVARTFKGMAELAIRVTCFPAIEIDADDHCRRPPAVRRKHADVDRIQAPV